MKEHIKKRFFEAVELKDRGELNSAKDMLLRLSEIEPRSVAILDTLGAVYWDMGLVGEAVDVFRRAVELAPRLEGASLCLFHCLWQSGKRVEALDEMKRFMVVSDSEDYRNILKEMAEKSESNPPLR